ncbi:small-conductance mechanosensitive channel [Lipingzhangella halophila]|uniref:Small-conductance mechanosensitive channel n=1 Tax=Lipingzhangella halophila TaxID=1783352 RepID=A0A7W7RI69_9ACTN|nr:mechanosensitive ion channel domain-containing protein [Lipingzhangella halophila]MBB4932454.1 small-conductance mechanosensitive channel [Lipingzhangella halophila]
MDVWQLAGIGIAVAIAVLVVLLVHWLLLHQLARVWSMARPLVNRCRVSGYAAAVVVGVNVARPSRSEMDAQFYGVIHHALTIAMIGALTWVAVSIAYAITDTILAKLATTNSDADRKSRRLQTQVRLMRRILSTIIGFVAFAAIMLTFDPVRGLGAGMLASAGLLSVVAGIAAQSTLGNLFAGLQLAFSDSLRIHDIIVIEGEWGRIEELSLVNVTLRIWDERRLVLPVSHFTDTPFENWTKESTAMTGWVMLRLDWGVPIAQLREELGNYVTQHPLWDGRRWGLQVTDILESGDIELRAVVTVADADARWDLCCDLREHLISYIHANFPEALPRQRNELSAPDEGGFTTAFPDPALHGPGTSNGSGSANPANGNS